MKTKDPLIVAVAAKLQEHEISNLARLHSTRGPEYWEEMAKIALRGIRPENSGAMQSAKGIAAMKEMFELQQGISEMWISAKSYETFQEAFEEAQRNSGKWRIVHHIIVWEQP